MKQEKITTANERRGDCQSQTGHGQQGFSLVELLIVVAILAIIIAIAVPNFLIARRSAQSSSMMGDLRTIHSAQTAFYLGAGRSTYGDFDALEGNNCLPSNFSNGATTYSKFGYSGNLVLGNANASYSMQVQNPLVSSISPSFYIDESGVLRYNNTGTATVNDMPVGVK